jgi:hypothetical protein
MIKKHNENLRIVTYGLKPNSFDSVEVRHGENRWVSQRIFYECDKIGLDTYLNDLIQNDKL